MKKVKDKESKCACPYLQEEETIEAEGVQAKVRGLREQRRNSWTEPRVFPTATLKFEKGPEHSPIFVVSVANEIINNHNDIYRPAFINFLRFFILMSVDPTEPDET